jgi:hypothetical protein
VFSLCAMTVLEEERRRSGERTLRACRGKGKIPWSTASLLPLVLPLSNPAHVHRVHLHTSPAAPIFDDGFAMHTFIAAFAHPVRALFPLCDTIHSAREAERAAGLLAAHNGVSSK